MNADWGNTPMSNATVRGFAIAIVLGLIAGANAYWRDGMTVNASVGEAIIPMLSAFVALLTYGVVDQQRANNGKVIAADVPVQIRVNELRAEGSTKSATTVAKDMGPGKR